MFKQLPQDAASVNALNDMCDPYIIAWRSSYIITMIVDACTYKGSVLSLKHIYKYCALFTYKNSRQRIWTLDVNIIFDKRSYLCV